LAEFDLGVLAPWVCTPKNVLLDYDVGKISAGCLVDVVFVIVHLSETGLSTSLCDW